MRSNDAHLFTFNHGLVEYIAQHKSIENRRGYGKQLPYQGTVSYGRRKTTNSVCVSLSNEHLSSTHTTYETENATEETTDTNHTQHMIRGGSTCSHTSFIYCTEGNFKVILPEQ